MTGAKDAGGEDGLGMLDTLDISGSALTAQRVRMDAIAQNIANVNTTHNPKGEVAPYKRRFAVFMAGRQGSGGPGVKAMVKEEATFREVYEPGRGYVKYPNIDLAVEYVNAMEASRAYEANVTTMEVTKSMFNATLRLLA